MSHLGRKNTHPASETCGREQRGLHESHRIDGFCAQGTALSSGESAHYIFSGPQMQVCLILGNGLIWNLKHRPDTNHEIFTWGNGIFVKWQATGAGVVHWEGLLMMGKWLSPALVALHAYRGYWNQLPQGNLRWDFTQDTIMLSPIVW